jgi:hypothetical protein
VPALSTLKPSTFPVARFSILSTGAPAISVPPLAGFWKRILSSAAVRAMVAGEVEAS